jgi:hypothetical protein
MQGNPNTPMENKTFDSVTVSVPANSNFTNDSGVFSDMKNQIAIQVIDQIIPKSQFQAYAKEFAKESNSTKINSTRLSNNTAVFKDSSNMTLILIAGENQTVVIISGNQELGLEMAKSVKFNE